jgi:hypothetical protein
VLGLPIVPVVLRARAAYQTALESGRSAVEVDPAGAAAAELGALWRFMEQLVFSPQRRLERRA